MDAYSREAALPADVLSSAHAVQSPAPAQALALSLSWLAVSLPLAWGVWETFRKALALFE